MTKGNSIDLTYEQVRCAFDALYGERRNRFRSAILEEEIRRFKDDIIFVEKIMEFLKDKSGIISINEEGADEC